MTSYELSIPLLGIYISWAGRILPWLAVLGGWFAWQALHEKRLAAAGPAGGQTASAVGRVEVWLSTAYRPLADLRAPLVSLACASLVALALMGAWEAALFVTVSAIAHLFLWRLAGRLPPLPPLPRAAPVALAVVGGVCLFVGLAAAQAAGAAGAASWTRAAAAAGCGLLVPLATLPLLRQRPSALQYLVLFSLVLALVTPTQYRFALDEAQWLFMAEKLLDGAGLVDISGNPSWYRIGYVLYYAAAYLAGGMSGAALAPALGLTLFVVSLFFLARRMFGDAVAIFAVVVFLSIPREAYLTGQLIDGLAGACTVSLIIAMLTPQGRNELGLGALLGLALFSASLVKETALVLIPLPLMLVLARTGYGSLKRAAATALSVAGALAAFSFAKRGWLTPTPNFFRSGDLEMQFVYVLQADAGWLANAGAAVRVTARGFLSYFYEPRSRTALLNIAFVFWLLPIAVIASMRRAASGRQEDRAILAAILCFLPLIAAVGWVQWRAEQALAAIGLFLLLIGGMLAELARLLPWPRAAYGAIVVLLAFGCIYQDVHGDGYFLVYSRSLAGHLIDGRSPHASAGLQTTPQLTALLNEQVPPGGRVWSSAPLPALSADLAGGGHFWVAPLPLHVLGMPGVASGYLRAGNPAIRGRIWGAFAPGAPSVTAPLLLLYADDLIQGREHVARVVLAWHLWPWLQPLPDLLAGRLIKPVGVQAPDPKATVYAWDGENFRRDIGRVFIDRGALAQLKLMRDTQPEVFRWYVAKLREGGLDVKDADLGALATSAEPVVELPRGAEQAEVEPNRP